VQLKEKYKDWLVYTASEDEAVVLKVNKKK
jgi:hypothetical protein